MSQWHIHDALETAEMQYKGSWSSTHIVSCLGSFCRGNNLRFSSAMRNFSEKSRKVGTTDCNEKRTKVLISPSPNSFCSLPTYALYFASLVEKPLPMVEKWMWNCRTSSQFLGQKWTPSSWLCQQIRGRRELTKISRPVALWSVVKVQLKRPEAEIEILAIVTNQGALVKQDEWPL